MTIADYLRQIRENAWSSRQFGTEFDRFVKRCFRAVTFQRGQGSPIKMTWEVAGVETAKDPGRAGFYALYLGKCIR